MKWVGVSVDFRYRYVPDLLGKGGVSAAFEEDDFGGAYVGVGMRLMFGGGSPPRVETPEPPEPQPSVLQAPRRSPDEGSGLIIAQAPVFLRMDATAEPLRILEAGTSVKVLAEIDDWVRIEFYDRLLGPRVGHVQRKYIPAAEAVTDMWTILSLAILSAGSPGAQTAGTCVPVSERAGREFGCFITAREELGALPSQSALYWHLDTFPTLAAARAATGPRGTVVESIGRIWLFTIADADYRPRGGTRVARIGPLPLVRADRLAAVYMEGVFHRAWHQKSIGIREWRRGTRWKGRCVWRPPTGGSTSGRAILACSCLTESPWSSPALAPDRAGPLS